MTVRGPSSCGTTAQRVTTRRCLPRPPFHTTIRHVSRRRKAPVGSTRDLTARSVLLSVLLGSDPPQLPVQLLVRTTELFGIAEGTTRTALSRMTSAGEVRGGDGVYRLVSAGLLARQAR